MSTMHTFYTRLIHSQPTHPYWQCLAQLTQVKRSTLASLQTVLWWSTWHSPSV